MFLLKSIRCKANIIVRKLDRESNLCPQFLAFFISTIVPNRATFAYSYSVVHSCTHRQTCVGLNTATVA